MIRACSFVLLLRACWIIIIIIITVTLISRLIGFDGKLLADPLTCSQRFYSSVPTD